MAIRISLIRRCAMVSVALLVPSGCSQTAEPTAQPPEPWVVTAEPALAGDPAETASRCNPAGEQCEPLQPGAKVEAPALIRTAKGAGAALKLAPDLSANLANGTEVVLTGGSRTVELRQGTMTIRLGSGAEVSPAAIGVQVGDSHVVLDQAGRTWFSARVASGGRAALTVHQGQIAVEAAGRPPVFVRGGETVGIAPGASPDKRAAWTGELPAVESVHAASGEKAFISPSARGLGRMTARIPGTEQVVSGVELVSHHVRVEVRDGFARTEVEEEFYNDANSVLEGRYVFPLPPRASISRLALWVNDELIEGEIVERKRAAAIFKEIVDDTVRPRDPALLEWVSGGEFSLKIFPIAPKKSRRVLLAYNEALQSEGGEMRYVYPLSLGADRATRIGDFSMTVTVHQPGSQSSRVESPRYPAVIEPGADRTTVRFGARSFVPASDFVVSYPVAEQSGASVSVFVPDSAEASGATLAERSAGEKESAWFALRLRAELPADAEVPELSRLDRVIVLDKSFSQGKETWEAQGRLAIGLLRGLGTDERFALLACDTACTSYPALGLESASPGSVGAAEQWLSSVAPSGASDVAGAILEGSKRVEGGHALQLIYVGDGVATAGELDAETIGSRIAAVVQARGVDLRLIGAGRTVDEVLLSGIARNVGATYEPLHSGDSLEGRIEAIAMHVRTPIVRAPALELPEGLTDVYPRVLPNLRLGEELVVVGKAATAAEGKVALRGRLGGKPYELKKDMAWPPDATRHNPLVPRLWAESRIAELGTSNAKEVVAEVIALSKRHHVMSRHTALLVLENEQMFREFGIDRTQRRDKESGGMGRLGARGAADRASPDSFGMVDSLSQPRDATGNMWGEPIGDAYGAGGLGLSGIGEGGGGRGDGIGLGSVGSIGHGAGTSSGQGFGSGSGRLAGSHKTSAPQVRMGATTVSGRLPPEVIQRIVRQNYGRFRACYESGLRGNPTLQGRVAVRFIIARDGSVTNVGDAGSDIPDASVSACVRAAFYGLSFPQPEGGIVTVVYPIVFSTPDGVSIPPSTSQRTWENPGPSYTADKPEPPAVHRAEDDAWRERGEKTIETLRQAVSRSEGSRKAHSSLVLGLLKNGRFEEALTTAERFAQLDPDLPAAREMLASAAAVNGKQQLATASIAALVELSPSSGRAQTRAAKAYEAIGDESRACAHWRAAAKVSSQPGQARYEAIRCTARVLGDRDAALRDIRSITNPDEQMRGLLASLEAGNAPSHEAKSGPSSDFEVEVTCNPGTDDCPVPIVIDPSGKVFSPWSPASARSNKATLAFYPSGGSYRTLLLGGAPGASGKVKIQARGIVRTFEFQRGGTQTVANTTVQESWYGFGRPRVRF